MSCVHFLSFYIIIILSYASAATSKSSVSLNLPQIPQSPHVVYSNFMGVSIELSTLDLYTGPSPTEVPTTVVNYFSNIRPSEGRALRLRIGGNSMDSSYFVPNQLEMLSFTGVNSSVDDVSCTFGPSLFDTLKAFTSAIGGAQIMMGLSLRNASSVNNTLLAAYAEQSLGSQLDALTLGNEPDLYSVHYDRPNLLNYTTEDYFQDFSTAESLLRNSSGQNLITTPLLAGPSVCCGWDLNALINDGYLRLFSDQLKYIALQHYPQNDCFRSHDFGLDYYLSHLNVVQLAGWQSAGINSSIAASKPVVLTEFNSASCGGIPGISDTFAASLWTADYALQLASVGFTAAYIHTREWNVTYSLFKSNGLLNGTWATQPSYYSLLPVVAALTPSEPGNGGSVVVDLNLNGSTVTNSSAAGYAIYDQDSPDPNPDRLVLFNYDSSSTLSFKLDGSSFGNVYNLPKGFGAAYKSVRISYLGAPSVSEPTNISWAGQTLAGVGDGRMVAAPQSFGLPDESMECDKQCEIKVQGPGLAVVWLDRTKVNNGSARSLPADTVKWYLRLMGLIALSLSLV